MNKAATQEQVERVVHQIEALNFKAHLSEGETATVIGVIGPNAIEIKDSLVHLDGVAQIIPITKPFKLSGREWHPDDSMYKIGDVEIGGDSVFVMAGPCAVESREQLMSTAEAVKASGAHFLRGGAFKPRTSPYTFQGMGLHGLKLLEEARAATGLPVITEVMASHDVEAVAASADILQIGARNMQNYPLLAEVGRSGRPALLKRGLSSTLDELLMAAEYILKEGNPSVMLCERGIRTFETAYRFTLDLMAVPVLKELSHLPVIVDPSHAAGRRDLVLPLSLAAAAAGADGIIVEVHPNPDEALCDGPQALLAEDFADYAAAVERAAALAGKAFTTA